jgi:hypothetical protein
MISVVRKVHLVTRFCAVGLVSFCYTERNRTSCECLFAKAFDAAGFEREPELP